MTEFKMNHDVQFSMPNIVDKEYKCVKCGELNRIALMPSDNYKYAYEKMKIAFEQQLASINDTIKWIETAYGENPYRDKMIFVFILLNYY